LTKVVDELLINLQDKFQTISRDLLIRMDAMSKRIDALETQIQASERKDGDAK